MEKLVKNQIDVDLLERAMACLKKHTGITTKQDGQAIQLNVAGLDALYQVKTGVVDRFAAIVRVKQEFERMAQPAMLVVPAMTHESAMKCRELGVQFIDTQGNAFLHGPGLYVWTHGQRIKKVQPADEGRMPPIATATALKIVFVLLCKPPMLEAGYRDIRQAANNVALGMIGPVLNDLRRRGYLVGDKKDSRLVERRRLLEEWAHHYPTRLRPKLHARRFHAPDPNWWKSVDIRTYAARWGGEIAAEKLTAYLRPEKVTIYMQPQEMRANLNQLVTTHRLRAAADGEIEILEAFWAFDADPDMTDVVPPLLVYADLMTTLEPRNMEVAQLLLEQINHGAENTG